MNQNQEKIINNAELKKKIVKSINSMLECIFSKGNVNCNKCKDCHYVDSCCFLMDAVYVCRHQEANKTDEED
jgi:hypothetical protein